MMLKEAQKWCSYIPDEEIDEFFKFLFPWNQYCCKPMNDDNLFLCGSFEERKLKVYDRMADRICHAIKAKQKSVQVKAHCRKLPKRIPTHRLMWRLR